MINAVRMAFVPVFVLAPAAAWAQFTSAPHPEGVEMDAKGVLYSAEKKWDPRLKELRRRAKGGKEEGGMVYVSLPRLFAEARRLADAGEKLPPRIRFLGGMVRLRYVFVFPEEGDLVIAGPAEPFDADVPYRPLGRRTGRPVLHLDDLVVAIRAAGPGTDPSRIGCDILITKEVAERVNRAVEEVSKKLQAIGARKAAEEIARRGGTQPVRYYGIPEDSRFAFVCVEADYRLKQLGLDLLKPPVRKLRSYFRRLRRPEPHHRFSLESHYTAIRVSPDSNAFELEGPSLKVNSGLLRVDGTTAKGAKISSAARAYMDQCNKYFDELCRDLISWADLQNLSDLTILAALIDRYALHRKVGWDLSWIQDPDGYAVARYKTPRSARVLCNTRHAGGMVLFTSGGVGLFPGIWMDRITVAEKGRLEKLARRPGRESWIETEKAEPGKEGKE